MNAQLTLINKDEIITNFCRSYPEFNNFVCNENIRSVAMIWFHDPNLQGADAETRSPIFGKHRVAFKKKPEDIDDMYLVAHELMHIIRGKNKESLIIYKKNPTDKSKIAAFTLSNMLEDPIVDRILINNYNINTLNHYENGLIKMKNDLLANVNLKILENLFAECQVVLNLSKQKLKWHLIKNYRSNIKRIEYEKWLRENYSDLVTKRDALVSFIESDNLLDTKIQHKYIFDEIVEIYELSDVVYSEIL